jgi:N-carbamoyl-L-amino-acid hydrolase
MPLTLEQLNTAPLATVLQQLDGLYEHSPWIAAQTLQQRPFASLAHFEHALARTVTDAGRDAQLALVRADPELASRAAVRQRAIRN